MFQFKNTFQDIFLYESIENLILISYRIINDIFIYIFFLK